MRGIMSPGYHHDDVIKWKYFPRYWPFVRGIHRSPVNSPHKGQWRGALMFSLICALNKRLSKQWWGWWFETPSCPLWRHCNDWWCRCIHWHTIIHIKSIESLYLTAVYDTGTHFTKHFTISPFQHSQSNSMEISFCSYLNSYSHQIGILSESL